MGAEIGGEVRTDRAEEIVDPENDFTDNEADGRSGAHGRNERVLGAGHDQSLCLAFKIRIV